MFKLNFLKKHSIVLGLFCCIILFFIIYRAWLPSNRFNRGHLDGDSYSEKNVLCAGEHFFKKGFIKCRFLPIHKKGPLGENTQYYTHYPPLPDIINGFLRMGGFQSIFSFRLFSVFLSIVMLTMLYLLIKVLFNDALIALIGTIYTGMTPYFLFFADNLQQHLYNELFVVGAILCFILFDKKLEKIYIIWTCFFVFLLSLTSFEYIIYLLIFFWGYYFIFRRDWPIKYLLIFSSSIFCGLFLHFAQNVWALGGIKEAFFDLKTAFYHRTIGKVLVNSAAGLLDHSLDKEVMKGFIPEIIRRIDYFFSINIVILLSSLFSLQFLCAKRENLKFYYKILGLLFFCGISWWIFFVQHTVIHAFTGRHIMLFIVLLVSILIKELLYYVFKYPQKSFFKVTVGVVLLAMIIISVTSRFVIIYGALFLFFLKF